MSRVEWGKDESLGNATAEYVSLDTTHRHVLYGLEPDTTYYYRIVLSDWSGNVTEVKSIVHHAAARGTFRCRCVWS